MPKQITLCIAYSFTSSIPFMCVYALYCTNITMNIYLSKENIQKFAQSGFKHQLISQSICYFFYSIFRYSTTSQSDIQNVSHVRLLSLDLKLKCILINASNSSNKL